MTEEITFKLYGDKYTVFNSLEENGIEIYDGKNDDVIDQLRAQLEYVEVNYAVNFEQESIKPLAVYIDGIEFRPVENATT